MLRDNVKILSDKGIELTDEFQAGIATAKPLSPLDASYANQDRLITHVISLPEDYLQYCKSNRFIKDQDNNRKYKIVRVMDFSKKNQIPRVEAIIDRWE